MNVLLDNRDPHNLFLLSNNINNLSGAIISGCNILPLPGEKDNELLLV
jgi:hypothetical protein